MYSVFVITALKSWNLSLPRKYGHPDNTARFFLHVPIADCISRGSTVLSKFIHVNKCNIQGKKWPVENSRSQKLLIQVPWNLESQTLICA